MRFSPLDSSEDFMGRGGLRFSLSLIVSELWHHQWRHNERCGLHSGREPRSAAASYVLAFILLQLSRAIPSFDYLKGFEISHAGFYRLDTQLTSTNHSESFCYFHLLIFSSLIYCYTYSYLLLHLHLASCLQCFDIVGWAAGRASGL